MWCTALPLAPVEAEVAFECEQGSISAPSIHYIINGQNAKLRPNQWFGASAYPWEYFTYSPRLARKVRMTSNPVRNSRNMA